MTYTFVDRTLPLPAPPLPAYANLNSGVSVDVYREADAGRYCRQPACSRSAADFAFDPNVPGTNTISLKNGSVATVLLTGERIAARRRLHGGRERLLGNAAELIAGPGFPSFQAGDGHGPAIAFDSNGLPSVVGVAKMAVEGFVSGAASIDGVDAALITLDFGSAGEADGITQLSAEFTPNFIEQNGARFGVYSGVTISADGVVSALFDNGERRPIYRLPLVTFANPDGLDAKTGNVWSTTGGLRQSDVAGRRTRDRRGRSCNLRWRPRRSTSARNSPT